MLDQKQTFSEFMLGCSRAFGALVHMRDDPSTAAIPEQLVASDYYLKQQKVAETELQRLLKLSAEQQCFEGETLKRTTLEAKYKAQEVEADEASQICTMIKLVEIWSPPTSEHFGLKTFALDQLRRSLPKESNWIKQSIKESEAKSEMKFFYEKIASLKQNIEYYKKEYAEEKKRIEGANNWLQALRESLNES